MAPLTTWMLYIVAAYFVIGFLKRALGWLHQKYPKHVGKIRPNLVSDVLELGIIAGVAFATRDLPLLRSLSAKLHTMAAQVATIAGGSWAPVAISVIVTLLTIAAAILCAGQFRNTRARSWLFGYVMAILVVGLAWPLVGDVVQAIFIPILVITERVLVFLVSSLMGVQVV